MATLILTVDTRASPTGFVPLDAEIGAALVDVFYLACLRGEYQAVSLTAYEVEIQRIHYSNPFELVTYFRNISARTANALLDRTLFYKEAKEARTIANDKAHQEVIAAKIENALRLAQARKKLLSGGFDEREVAKLLGDISYDQAAMLQVKGPENQRRQEERER